MYICIYMYIYIYICICIYVYIYICIYLHVEAGLSVEDVMGFSELDIRIFRTPEGQLVRALLTIINQTNKFDGFVGKLTFSNHLMNTRCDIRKRRGFALQALWPPTIRARRGQRGSF